MTNRRHFLAASFALTPLAAAISACARSGSWAPGMQPIVWDRDPCAHCGMVISDRRFATEICNVQNKTAFKFDDIGCAMNWRRQKAQEQPWSANPATPIWVADSANKGNDVAWLDARTARYIHKSSPMGYDFGATPANQTGAVDFQTMNARVLALAKRS